MNFSTSCFSAGLSVRVSRTRRASSRGFTMIEMLAVLALAALMIGGVATMINSTPDDTRAQQAALYQAQLTAAATRLIEQNYTALTTQATASIPVVAGLTDTTYQLSNFLSNATGATNAYGQTACLLIYGTATPGALQALLVTEGGSAIPDPSLGYAAANAGAGGGSIQATNNASGAANARSGVGRWPPPTRRALPVRARRRAPVIWRVSSTTTARRRRTPIISTGSRSPAIRRRTR